jgi:hypothetical protein
MFSPRTCSGGFYFTEGFLCSDANQLLPSTGGKAKQKTQLFLDIKASCDNLQDAFFEGIFSLLHFDF